MDTGSWSHRCGFLVLMVSAVVSAHAATVRVPADQPTIQAGIDAAAEGDTVLVAPGTYTGDGNKNLAFSRTNRVLRSEAGPDSTVIDCEGVGRGFYLDSFETEASVIEGFTITGAVGDVDGGGLYLSYSRPTIIDCHITGNAAQDFGGGVYVYGASPTFIECTITGNVAKHGGGVVCGTGNLVPDTPVFVDCEISGNQASDDGGGMYVHATRPLMTRTLVSGNTATHGGGFYGWFAFPEFTDCTFSDNVAHEMGGALHCLYSNPMWMGGILSGNAAGEAGGGISAWSSSKPTLSRTTISGNSSFLGGGICCASSELELFDCTISGNAAEDGGGLHFREYATPTMVNCMITGNQSTRGGGLYCENDSAPNLINCTVADNAASNAGGGVYSDRSDVHLTNCIVWGDTPDALYSWYGDMSLDHCDIEGAWPGEGTIHVDPRFVDPAAGDYHLLETSPCVDSGSPDGAPETDFEGEPRPWGLGFDMGADEYAVIVCELELAVTDVPDSLARGGTGSFTATISNGCEELLGFDAADMIVTGPVSLERPLHGGRSVPVGVGESIDAPVAVPVARGTPLGTYTVEVAIYREGVAIDAQAFEVEVIE